MNEALALLIRCFPELSSLRILGTARARERREAPIIGMAPKRSTARKLSLVWGVYPLLTHDVAAVSEITEFACRTAVREGLAKAGQTIVIAAGMPFGTPGTTNLLRIAQIE